LTKSCCAKEILFSSNRKTFFLNISVDLLEEPFGFSVAKLCPDSNCILFIILFSVAIDVDITIYYHCLFWSEGYPWKWSIVLFKYGFKKRPPEFFFGRTTYSNEL
tara:strand:+ start:4292 stop:4606 length:315 start_codon:yes stop_codon:yes gene_type:complete